MKNDINFVYTISTEKELGDTRQSILEFMGIYFVNHYRITSFYYGISTEKEIGVIRRFILFLLNISFVDYHVSA